MIKLGVPYSNMPATLDIVNTAEDEAMAMAFGIELAGCEAYVYMQDDGYLKTLNVLTTLLMPYGVSIFINIKHREDLEHHIYANQLSRLICSYVAEKMLSV